MNNNQVNGTQQQVTVESLLLQALQLLQAQQQQAPKLAEPQQAASPEQETMDVAEAAKYLRVSEWTVYDLVRTKKIPNFRVRKRIFFRRRELEQWIAQGMNRVGMG